jgi:putative membrane protein
MEDVAVSDLKHSKSLWKGLVAGLVAGVVATAAKSIAEKFYPPRTHGEPNPPEALAEKVAGHPLSQETKAVAGEAIHWGFGVGVGGAYGMLAEYYPAATSKEGASFGLVLMSLTHETALPALGVAADAEDQTPREHTSEAATHLIYGVVIEKVRHFVRGLLG